MFIKHLNCLKKGNTYKQKTFFVGAGEENGKKTVNPTKSKLKKLHTHAKMCTYTNFFRVPPLEENKRNDKKTMYIMYLNLF